MGWKTVLVPNMHVACAAHYETEALPYARDDESLVYSVQQMYPLSKHLFTQNEDEDKQGWLIKRVAQNELGERPQIQK